MMKEQKRMVAKGDVAVEMIKELKFQSYTEKQLDLFREIKGELMEQKLFAEQGKGRK